MHDHDTRQPPSLQVSFTSLSNRLDPETALMALHNIFSVLDHVVGFLRGYKYEVSRTRSLGPWDCLTPQRLLWVIDRDDRALSLGPQRLEA